MSYTDLFFTYFATTHLYTLSLHDALPIFKGIELESGDEVVALEVVAEGTVLTVTGNGYGKKTDLAEYRLQSRGGKGLIKDRKCIRLNSSYLAILFAA